MHRLSIRLLSGTNLSYLVGSPLSGWSLEGLQPDLLHHGNLVGRLLNRLPPCGGTGKWVAVPWHVGVGLTNAPGYAPYLLSCVERGMTSSQGAVKCSGRNESAPLFLPSSIGGGAFDDLGD